MSGLSKTIFELDFLVKINSPKINDQNILQLKKRIIGRTVDAPIDVLLENKLSKL